MNSVFREPRCVIISAGTFCGEKIDLEDEDFCIACDAGYGYARKMGIYPDLIVGDFDSAAEAGKEILSDIGKIASLHPERVVQLQVQKDDTDTLAAVRIGLERGYRNFYLYGALGGERFDHSFANIQSLLFIKHHGGTGYIVDRDRMLMVIENETVRFNRGNTGKVSVFSLLPQSRGVYLRGLMYSADDITITSDFPVGVSNEFIIDEEAEITVEDGCLLIAVSGG